MFLCLVQFRAVFQTFKIGPQDTDSVEKVTSKIKIVFFSQSQLIVIVIQALLGQSDHLGRFL